MQHFAAPSVILTTLQRAANADCSNISAATNDGTICKKSDLTITAAAAAASASTENRQATHRQQGAMCHL